MRMPTVVLFRLALSFGGLPRFRFRMGHPIY
jgi:hypothetical protein